MSDARRTPPAPAPRAARGLRIALAVSLALNLLVAGLIGGAFLARGGDGRDAPALRLLGLAPVALALPREARADLRARIGAEAPALRRERAAIGRAFRDVQRALLAEPFDRAAAGQALSRARLAASELQARGHAALLDTLEEMPPEARAAVAERLGRAMRRVEARDRQSASQAAGSPASVTWSRPSDFAP